jgi:hypothetical protein
MDEKERQHRLHFVPDELTRFVDRVLDHALAQFDKSGGLIPALFYVENKRLHVVPLDYGSLVESGREVRLRTSRGQVLLGNLGFGFAMWSIALSERAANPQLQREDRSGLLNDIEGLLVSVRPQAFVTAWCPTGPPEVVVVGKNPVRTYAKIAHPLPRMVGLPPSKTEVRDSLRGDSCPDEMFARLYQPCKN